MRVVIGSLTELWERCLVAVLCSEQTGSDDGAMLREVALWSGSVQVDVFDPRELERLRAMATDPIRAGRVDKGGATNYGTIVDAAAILDLESLLQARPSTKRATLQLRERSGRVPCLTTLDFKLRSGTCELTAFFRSQDVWRRQPDNLVFLASVLTEIGAACHASHLRLSLVVASAHIYDRDEEDVRSYVDQHVFRRSGVQPAIRKRTIAVVGREKLSWSQDDHGQFLRWAVEIGVIAGSRGFTVLSGGLGGVMEAVSLGASLAGGLSVGLVPVVEKEEEASRVANEFQSVVIRTGLKQRERIPMLVRSSDALIAVNGGGGTRVEVDLALQLGIPVVALRGSGGVADELAADQPTSGVHVAGSPKEAVDLCSRLLTVD